MHVNCTIRAQNNIRWHDGLIRGRKELESCFFAGARRLESGEDQGRQRKEGGEEPFRRLPTIT